VSIFRDGFDADEESKDEEVFKYLTSVTEEPKLTKPTLTVKNLAAINNLLSTNIVRRESGEKSRTAPTVDVDIVACDPMPPTPPSDYPVIDADPDITEIPQHPHWSVGGGGGVSPANTAPTPPPFSYNAYAQPPPVIVKHIGGSVLRLPSTTWESVNLMPQPVLQPHGPPANFSQPPPSIRPPARIPTVVSLQPDGRLQVPHQTSAPQMSDYPSQLRPEPSPVRVASSHQVSSSPAQVTAEQPPIRASPVVASQTPPPPSPPIQPPLPPPDGKSSGRWDRRSAPQKGPISFSISSPSSVVKKTKLPTFDEMIVNSFEAVNKKKQQEEEESRQRKQNKKSKETINSRDSDISVEKTVTHHSKSTERRESPKKTRTVVLDPQYQARKRREREAKEGREKGAQRTGNDEDKSSDPTPTTSASIDTHTQSKVTRWMEANEAEEVAVVVLDSPAKSSRASTVGVESMSSIASSAGALALQQAAKAAAAAGSNKADSSFVEDYFRKKAAGNDNTEPGAFVKQYFKDLETSKEINPPSSQNSNPKDTSSNAAHKNKDGNNGNGDFVDQHYEELQGVINKRRSSTLAKEMSKSKSSSDRSRDNQQKYSTKQTPDVVDLCDSD